RSVFGQYSGAIPARPVSRPRLGPRRRGARRVGSDHRVRICRERSRAVEYHSSRRLRQEHPAGPVRAARLDDPADLAAEAAQMMPMLRADLHVHTCHSNVSGNMRFLGSRDCYSKPADVYRLAKARGMDLVAFTDHDSIGGALELLDARPDLTDVIVGEEVSCLLPDGDVVVHLAVYGMTESLHGD